MPSSYDEALLSLDRASLERAMIDENLLSPIRAKHGGHHQELVLFPDGSNHWKHARARETLECLPSDVWTATWDEFADELPEPEKLGDEGRVQLEVVTLLAFLQHIPRLVTGIPWMALQHQAGGVACTQPAFVARRLFPRPSIYPALRAIARSRWPSHPGDRFDARDAPMVDCYRRDLARSGLRRDDTIRVFTESVYPIDATNESLDVVSANRVRLEDLIEGFDPRFEQGNVAIVVLTTNSD